MKILKGPSDTETLEVIQGLSILKLIELIGQHKSHECIFDLGINNNVLITDIIDETDVLENTPLHLSAYYGYPRIAQYLINKGYNINAINKYGSTPLITATIKDNLEIIKLLISYNADVTIRDNLGKTALDHAIDRGRNDIFEFLTNGI